MLPCLDCAYRDVVLGSEHSRCVFDWFRPENAEGLVTKFQRVTPRIAHWFRFPFNYDPTWGPNECSARNETRDPSQLAKPNPLADLRSL